MRTRTERCASPPKSFRPASDARSSDDRVFFWPAAGSRLALKGASMNSIGRQRLAKKSAELSVVLATNVVAASWKKRWARATKAR